MDFGWTMPWDEYAGDFHESFMKKLSVQLETKIDKVVGIKNVEKYGFQLIVGMVPLEIEIKGNRVFATIELITPHSFSYKVRIFWESNEIEKIEIVHQLDVLNKNIEFEWADGFPIEDVVTFCKPVRIKKKEKSGFEFDVEYFHFMLPDVMLYFLFSKELDLDLYRKIKIFAADYEVNWNNNKEGRIIYMGSFSQEEKTIYCVNFDLHSETHTRCISKFIKDFSITFPKIGLEKMQMK